LVKMPFVLNLCLIFPARRRTRLVLDLCLPSISFAAEARSDSSVMLYR